MLHKKGMCLGKNVPVRSVVIAAADGPHPTQQPCLSPESHVGEVLVSSSREHLRGGGRGPRLALAHKPFRGVSERGSLSELLAAEEESGYVQPLVVHLLGEVEALLHFYVKPPDGILARVSVRKCCIFV